MSGEPGRCRAAAELLQSLLDTVSSLPATLQLPGVARFLWDKGGQSLLRQLENTFQCVIELDGSCWNPPDPQVLHQGCCEVGVAVPVLAAQSDAL